MKHLKKPTSKTNHPSIEEFEKLIISRVETEKAMLNVMEDLEKAQLMLEVDKAMDEAMLASISEGLIAVNNQRKIILVNKEAERILGWKAHDLLGKDITSLPLLDERSNPIPIKGRPTTLALAGNQTTNEKYIFVRQDKTTFPIRISCAPIKLKGKTLGLVEIIRNITHEQAIDKAKTEFVSLASHQLRTPLGIIKWSLEALENEEEFKNLPTSISKYFVEISKCNERLLSLVRDLLSVSRIEANRVKDKPSSVNIFKLITEIVEQMQFVASRKKVNLHLTFEDKDIQSIQIDLLRFHEVIENLIANSIEYSMPEGKVEVLVKLQEENLLISVTDHGIGISEQDKNRLFVKFFRSERATQHNPEGSGLGLYVVKSYVEGWGGKIAVKSEEGKGAAFTISLPLTQKGGGKNGKKKNFSN